MSVTAVLVAHAAGNLHLGPPSAIVEPTPALYLVAQLTFVIVAAFYAAAAFYANEEYLSHVRDANRHLRAQRDQLDAQAEQLNRSLAEAESARQAADAASRAKSEFLAIMSHEIRTPLNGVVGLNSLLLSLPLEERARHYAELGRQSGEALVGDAGRLRQVLVNLLGNAVKFTERGGVMLRGRSQKTNNGVRLVIDVIDTGIGMDDYLAKPVRLADLERVVALWTRPAAGGTH